LIKKKEDEKLGFLSSDFTYLIKSNASSALLSFALLDLPFEGETHGFKAMENRGLEIKAVDNLILF